MSKIINTSEPPADGKQTGGGFLVVVCHRVRVFFFGADGKQADSDKAMTADSKPAAENFVAGQGSDKETPADDSKTTAEDVTAEQGDNKEAAATDNIIIPVADKTADKNTTTDDALTTALQEAAAKHERALVAAKQEAAEEYERALATAKQEIAEEHERALAAAKQEAAEEYERALATAKQEIAEEYERTLATTKQEAAEKYDTLLRKAAELDNLRRRADRETENAINRAINKIALAMCDVRDCFVAAIDDETQTADNLRQGVQFTLQKADSELRNNGILPVHPDNGAAFDPELHEAVATEENADLPEGAIIRTLRTGYTINSRLLRPASVIVSKPAAQQSEGEPVVQQDENENKSTAHQDEGNNEPAAQQDENDKPAAETKNGGKDE